MAFHADKVLLILPTHKFDVFIENLVLNSDKEYNFEAVLFNGQMPVDSDRLSNVYNRSYSLGHLSFMSLFFNLVKVRRIIIFSKPSIIHVTSYLGGLLIALTLLTLPKKPKFLWNRHYNRGHHELRFRHHVLLDKFISWRADAIVVISHSQFETLTYLENVSSSKVHVINNGIEIKLNEISKVSRDHFKVLFKSIAGEKKVFLAVGRLHPEKDYPTLFRSLSIVQKAGIPFHLFIAGEGHPEYKSALRDLSKSLNLDSQITFLGWRDDVHAAILESDLFVQSSRDEAFGLSILEAGVLGIPIACTTPGGVIEVLSPHQRFIAPSDAESLAELIISQLNISKDSLQFVSDELKVRFTISRMSRKYNNVYRFLQSDLSEQ